MSDMSRGCELCGLDVGIKPFALSTPAGELVFCCEACRGIYEMLHGIDATVPATPNDASTGDKS
jgi:hypothetical protein